MTMTKGQWNEDMLWYHSILKTIAGNYFLSAIEHEVQAPLVTSFVVVVIIMKIESHTLFWDL